MAKEVKNCFKCKHFYITWDKNFPKGCKFFGFKSSDLPSKMVIEATGDKCLNYDEKR